MARIKTKILNLKNKPADVVGIRVYFADKQGLDYTAEHKVVELPADKNSVIVPTDIPHDWQDKDYYLGVTYLDAYGNESSIMELLDPFDFIPPPTPEVEVVDGDWIYI